MRRKDRQMDEDFALQVIDKCAYAVLSTVLPDGTPYGIPLSVARVGEDLYFHCAPAGRKLEGLLHNPAVSIACVGDVTPRTDDFTTEFESALIAGRAVRVTEDEEKIAALRAISLRYTPDNMDRFDDAVARSLSRTDVWRVSMDQVTGKQKKYGPDGREIKSGISK